MGILRIELIWKWGIWGKKSIKVHFAAFINENCLGSQACLMPISSQLSSINNDMHSDSTLDTRREKQVSYWPTSQEKALGELGTAVGWRPPPDPRTFKFKLNNHSVLVKAKPEFNVPSENGGFLWLVPDQETLTGLYVLRTGHTIY